MSELETTIAGCVYGVRYNAIGEIKETCCVGRWGWSEAPTGDPWLDKQLQLAVNAALHAF